jgi:4-hydroxy-2-oxoheptanedioate aldolase
VFGTFLTLGNPVIAEIIARAGYDWVLLDLEHGLGSEQDVLHQLQAISATATPAIVRVEGHARQRIHRVLDLGADGIMCPRIETAEDAAQAVRAMRYTPEGVRGVAKMVRASNFGIDFADYARRSREDLLGVIQIETLESLNHLDAIAALDGVDVLFIGPADLSMALGIFGQLEHPRFVEAIEASCKAARNAGKAVGFLLFDPAEKDRYYDFGIRFFACGSDSMFVQQGARRCLETAYLNWKA